MNVLPATTAAPVFTATSITGQNLDLATHPGPLILVFAHPIINASRLVVGYMRRMAEIAPACPVWVIMESDEASAKKYAGEAEAAYLTMPVATDNGEIAKSYNASLVPAVYFINAGKIVRSYSGFNRDFLNTIAREAAELTGAKSKELISDGDNKGFYELAERVPGR